MLVGERVQDVGGAVRGGAVAAAAGGAAGS